MRAGWLRWALEVAAVWLMPWRAVEHAKDLETSVTFMIHVFIRQNEYREDLEVRLGVAAPKPKPRPLHLVLQQGGRAARWSALPGLDPTPAHTGEETVPESSQTSGEEPFDVEKFARQTIASIEFGDDDAELLEERVMRLEEIIAARWPRSWLLRRRLAREIRASVARRADDYARGDFRGRRGQWHAEQVSVARRNRERRQAEQRQHPEGEA